MSKNLVLENFIHNSLCDIPGCREMARQTLGAEGASGGLKLNICPECLQTIVNIVPLEMIMNRPDIAEMLQEDEEENSPIKANNLCNKDAIQQALEKEKPIYISTGTILADKLENVGKALEGAITTDKITCHAVTSDMIASNLTCKEGLDSVTFHELSFNAVKSLAEAKGLKFKVGMSKADLIQFLTEN